MSEATIDIRKYLEINLDDLQGEMVRQSASGVYLAGFYKDALYESLSAKNRVDAIKAAKFIEFKSAKLDSAEEKKFLTDKAVEALVESDELVIKAKDDAVKTKADEAHWNLIMQFMSQKGFILRDLATMDSNQAKNSVKSYENMMGKLVEENGRGDMQSNEELTEAVKSFHRVKKSKTY